MQNQQSKNLGSKCRFYDCERGRHLGSSCLLWGISWCYRTPQLIVNKGIYFPLSPCLCFLVYSLFFIFICIPIFLQHYFLVFLYGWFLKSFSLFYSNKKFSVESNFLSLFLHPRAFILREKKAFDISSLNLYYSNLRAPTR